MLTITVDTTEATAMLAKLAGPAMTVKLSASLTEAALLGERLVAAKTPVRTGVLRASVKAQATGPLAWRIASPLDYAAVVESGSQAHEIRPRRARILSFMVGGTRVFARRVRHPGTRGAQMFAQSAPEIGAALPAIVQRQLAL